MPKSDNLGAENMLLLRKQLGWSQTELARVLKIDNNHVSAWERGKRKPSYDNCLRLIEVAAEHGVKIDEGFLRPDKDW
jgi:transcriptional regulator with XRE-family HTH domain